MATKRLSRRQALSNAESGGSVDPALTHLNAIDAINQATSILEYLVGNMGEDGDDTNAAFGQYLLYHHVAKQMRAAVDQLTNEMRPANTLLHEPR